MDLVQISIESQSSSKVMTSFWPPVANWSGGSESQSVDSINPGSSKEPSSTVLQGEGGRDEGNEPKKVQREPPGTENTIPIVRNRRDSVRCTSANNREAVAKKMIQSEVVQ